MPPVVRNVLAVISGLVVGYMLNGGLIMLTGNLVAPPEGVNPNNLESIKAHIHLYKPVHFLIPFLAHALGTFAGALVTALVAATHKLRLALVIGVFFLMGGISMCFMIPAPVWFMAADIIIAYIPMALLGGRLGGGKSLSA